MRTNPFRDAWLFLIGATKDQEALDSLRWIFVVLLLALLAASLWFAVTNWLADREQRRAGHVTIWICRVLVGCMWFQGCLWKLPLPLSDGFEYWTGQMADHAAFQVHREIVKSLFLPNLEIIDPLVFLAELAFAISLILGFGVRLWALVGTVYCLHLWLGLYQQPSEWPWTYVFLAIIHALFVVVAAGRSFGVDALLHRRKPAGVLRLLAATG